MGRGVAAGRCAAAGQAAAFDDLGTHKESRCAGRPSSRGILRGRLPNGVHGLLYRCYPDAIPFDHSRRTVDETSRH